MLRDMKNRAADLAVALDVPHAEAVAPLLARLPSDLRWCKVGLELFCAAGPSVVESLRSEGKQVFLDLKLHDIPRTVHRAVQTAARHGARLLTIHAGGGQDMIKAAVEAARATSDGSTRIIAVTALTSLSERDLRDVGVAGLMTEHVERLAELACRAGADGLVCSPLEVNRLRSILGPAPILVTPGVRALGDAKGDQKRTATAGEAVAQGSDLLVVGRPIVEAPDPHAAALAIMSEIAQANELRQHGTTR